MNVLRTLQVGAIQLPIAMLLFAFNAGMSPLLVDIGADLGVPAADVGHVVGVTAAAWAVFGLLAFQVLRRARSARVTSVAAVVTGLLCILSTTADDLRILLAWRLLAGATAGLAAAGAQTFTMQIAKSNADQTWRLGIYTAGMSLGGVVVVPAIAWLGGTFGWRAAMIGLGIAILVAGALAGLTKGPSPLATERERTTYRYASLVGVVTSNVLERAGFLCVVTFLPLYLSDRVGLDTTAMAPVLLICYLAAAVGSGGAGHLLSGVRGGHNQVLWVAVVAIAGGLACLSFLTEAPALVIVALAAAASMLAGAGRPLNLRMISFVVTPPSRSMAWSVFGNQVGAVVGASMTAVYLSLTSIESLGPWVLGLGLASATVALLLVRVPEP